MIKWHAAQAVGVCPSLRCSHVLSRHIPCIAGTFFASMAPAHGGNKFHLFAFDCSSGVLRQPPVLLWPTPDTQGPSGLMAYRPASANTSTSTSTDNTNTTHRGSSGMDGGGGGTGDGLVLIAFMPTDTNGTVGGWELVAINPTTGKVSPTATDRGLPAVHLLDSGASFIVPAHAANRAGAGAGAGARVRVEDDVPAILYAALASEPGAPSTMYGVDLECALALSSRGNCTRSTKPWPPVAGTHAPVDLGLFLP
jgi:hypothetical protein